MKHFVNFTCYSAQWPHFTNDLRVSESVVLPCDRLPWCQRKTWKTTNNDRLNFSQNTVLEFQNSCFTVFTNTKQSTSHSMISETSVYNWRPHFTNDLRVSESAVFSRFTTLSNLQNESYKHFFLKLKWNISLKFCILSTQWPHFTNDLRVSESVVLQCDKLSQFSIGKQKINEP